MSAQAFSDGPIAHNGGYTQVAGDVVPIGGTQEKTDAIYRSNRYQNEGGFHPNVPSAQIILLPQRPTPMPNPTDK